MLCFGFGWFTISLGWLSTSLLSLSLSSFPFYTDLLDLMTDTGSSPLWLHCGLALFPGSQGFYAQSW
jgi:hypothetical protein